MRLSSPGKSTRRREIARPQTRRRKGSFFFSAEFADANIGLSRFLAYFRTISPSMRESREKEKSPFSLSSAPRSRGRLPETSGTRACFSRRGKRTAAFNVNRYARFIYAGEKSARETKSRAAEGESKREKERTSDTAATQQIGETENEVERGGKRGGIPSGRRKVESKRRTRRRR